MQAFNLVKETQHKTETHPVVAIVLSILCVIVISVYSVVQFININSSNNINTIVESSVGRIVPVIFTCQCIYNCVINAHGSCTALLNNFSFGNTNHVRYNQSISLQICSMDYLVFSGNSNATMGKGVASYQLYGQCLPSIELPIDTDIRKYNISHIGTLNGYSVDISPPWRITSGHAIMTLFPLITDNKYESKVTFNYINTLVPLVLFDNWQSIPCYSLWHDIQISDCAAVQLTPTISLTSISRQVWYMTIAGIVSTYPFILIVFNFTMLFIRRIVCPIHEKNNDDYNLSNV